MPVLTVSATLLVLVQTEPVLGVVTHHDVNTVGAAALSHTVVSHHGLDLSLSPRIVILVCLSL